MENNEIDSAEMHNFLIRRLGEREADEVMGYIHNEVQKQVSENTSSIRNEIDQWRNELKNVFATKDDAAKLQTKLVKRVSGAESTLILWTFVFWLTNIVAVLCFLKFFK